MLILSCLLNSIAYILAQYLFFDKKVKKPVAYVIGLVIFSAISFIPAFSFEETDQRAFYGQYPERGPRDGE